MACQAILLLGFFFAFASRPSAISCAPNHRIMTKSSPPPVERAFTLMEVLVVMVIIIGLAAILIPSLNSALVRAKATKDLSNLRQIGAATQMYMNDNNGVFPGSTAATWMSQLEQNQKYLSAWRVLES